MFFDPLYIIITLPAFLIGIAASLFLRYINGKYSGVINSNQKNGLDTATIIAEKNNFKIGIETVGGNLTDHYNPINQTVALSNDVAHKPSVASVGIAAHEMGHVEQHHQSFLLTSIRTSIAPVVNFGSGIGYVLILIGLIFGFLNLAYIGLILFAGTTVFTLITLPVEIDASRRAMRMIRNYNLVPDYQLGGARMVLIAAALTYVAATLQSLSQLLYFFLRVQGRD